jgi:hypothetical protein
MRSLILSTALAAFACSGLLPGCRTAADPAQLSAVDGMITSLEAAMLTLDELDHGRYVRVDSLYTVHQQSFAQRFRDTLGRHEALLLANHFLVLRAARSMGDDHLALREHLADAAQRLRNLRQDLASGIMDHEQGAVALARERLILQDTEESVHRALDNYRTVQRAWDDRTEVGSLLADAGPNEPPEGR